MNIIPEQGRLPAGTTHDKKGKKMKVSEAIELLAKRDPNEQICFALWTRDEFPDADGKYPLTDKQWSYIVADYESTEITTAVEEWIQDEITASVDYNERTAYDALQESL